MLGSNSAISRNWTTGKGIEVAKRRLKTRAEAFLKQAVNPGVFVSRFCRTIKLSTGLAVGSSARGHLRMPLRGCEITTRPLLVHLLRHLPKARCSPGFSCEDFAVLPTHVLDLAPLWITENPS